MGTYLNNDGAARNLTLRGYIGSTAICSTGTVSVTNSAGTRRVLWDFYVSNAAYNSQIGIQSITTHISGGAFSGNMSGHGTAAIDTSADAIIKCTVEHGTSSANIVFTKTAAFTEIL